MPSRFPALLIATLAVAAGVAHAHGGGLDRHGCHNDRKSGGYHCHRGAAPSSPATPLAPRTTPTPARFGSQPQPLHRAYRNCTEAGNAGAAPVHRGDPGYGTHLDRDGDGVGCEPYRER